MRLEPSSPPSTFGPLRFAPRRTIIAGAVADTVKGVAVVSTADRRDLPLGSGRAFLAVFPGSVQPDHLTLEITLRDGRVRRFGNPVAINRATTPNPPPRLHGDVRLHQDPPGSRRVILTARLTAPVPKRFEITFLGREVRMRRTGGPTSQPRYTGVYDGNRGARRPIVVGRVHRFSLKICGDSCSTRQQQARLR